ncbi:TRAP transporter large permease subunit [Neobacillus sp. LXY-4]|uniref:TRAP transporter large permease subunit n=1 Tax=Neobacillus sp. LXY-4 TaxID=3379826 RepID=UPI003EE1455F
MGIGILSLLVFIGVILLWFLIVKRPIGEAMLLGFIAICAMGGGKAFNYFIEGLKYGATYEVLYAALAFVLMAYIFDLSGVLGGLINILNSLLGRVPGGAAYMDVIASGALGLISGATTGNVAARGVFTIPWMKKTGFDKDLATTIASGNAGMAIAWPPCASMFILLGLAPIAAKVTEGQLYLAMLAAGAYQIIWRFIVVAFLIKKHNIKAVSEGVRPIRETFREGWTSLFVFLGAAIPIILTMSPIATYLSSEGAVGPEGMDTVSLITWMPIVISAICIFLGRKNFPKTFKGWTKIASNSISKFSEIGAVLLFAFAASYVLGVVGMGEELSGFLTSLSISPFLMVIIVGAIVVLVACPLSATATLTVIGLVAFSALTSVGVNPVIAVATILAWASTEGESMPTSGGIYVAAGIAESNPAKSFVPLFIYYVIPVMILGWMMAWGWLPIPV